MKPMPLYSEEPAPAPLARWVECSWTFETAAAERDHGVSPDGCLDILYDRDQGLRAIGAMTTRQRFHLASRTSRGGIRFRPGMATAFLKIPAAELTGVSTSLEDIWHAGKVRELRRRMDDARSIAAAMRLLLRALPAPAQPPDNVQLAIEAIAWRHGRVNLDHASAQAGLSARQFRHRCLEISGLTPKLLARILRFRHASRLAQGSIAQTMRKPDWAAIALEAHYFDQAHLIRDFREFTGQTPMSLFSNTPGPMAA